MADEKHQGGVRYADVPGDYLEKRRLRKSAGWVSLWAMAVGAVISGFFYGWTDGLGSGGFGGMALATALMAVMYVCLVYSIAELTAALPHAGGFYSFCRNAFGPFGGYVCGVTDVIEYVLSPAVIVVGVGGYLHGLVPSVHAYVWWLIAYALFVAVNIRGVEITLKVGMVITLLAIAVLAVFFVGALATGAFRAELLFDVPSASGETGHWLPAGWYGVFAALPFAIWFYLAIEQMPLAAEETHDVVKDVPRALTWGIATLLVLSVFILVLNPGVTGAAALAKSEAPLQQGLEAVFGKGTLTEALTLLALAGLLASFHSIIYAYGRVLFALSRAGYFPRWISLTGRNHTPYVALILGAAVGLLCALAIDLSKTPPAEGGSASSQPGFVGAALLNMAVFGAVISYILVMCSFIKLRWTRPDLPRPYKSPLGVPGAALGALLALVALFACFSVPDYRPAVWGVAAFLVAALLFFWFYSRHHLVARAPEEENALLAEANRELAH
jgi:ethanolamine permease